MSHTCPECESTKVVVEAVDHKFPYGVGPTRIILSATIPVFQCEACGAEYTGSEAEDLIGQAVRQHLFGDGNDTL